MGLLLADGHAHPGRRPQPHPGHHPRRHVRRTGARRLGREQGEPGVPGHQVQAPNDFTGIDDAREVYWCQGATSSIDGKPGSYVAVDGGHRYNLGQWPGGDPKVFPDAAC